MYNHKPILLGFVKPVPYNIIGCLSSIAAIFHDIGTQKRRILTNLLKFR